MENLSSTVFQNDNAASLVLNDDDKEKSLKQEQQRLRAMLLFRRGLKTRFEELLQAGKAMIGYDLASDVVLPSPVLKEESQTFKHHCESVTPHALQVALVEGLVPSFQNDNNTGHQFAACVSMLNTLVAKLSEFKVEQDDFVLNDDIENETTAESQRDVNTAVRLFGNMRSNFDKHQRAEKLKRDVYFTFDYHAEAFLEEKKGEVAFDTIEKYEHSFGLLRKVFPAGIDLRDFTKVKTKIVKDMLNSIDKHQNVGKEGERLSNKTKNGFLSNYRTFFSWVIKETDIDINNPFSNVSYPKEKSAPKRRSFIENEVRQILNYEFGHGSEAREFRTDAHWYPKVALYSGMRLNEISALPLSHIKQSEGVWYFDLHGLDVKNEASERTVPIAQYLLDLGILDYIDKQKSKGEYFLFPQIRRYVEEPGSSGWGDPISRWFNRTLLKNLGIDSESEKAKRYLISFHSMRRTLISTCVNNAEQHYLIKRIVGHSIDDDITLSVYSDVDKIPLATLKEVLDKNLKWHETI